MDVEQDVEYGHVEGKNMGEIRVQRSSGGQQRSARASCDIRRGTCRTIRIEAIRSQTDVSRKLSTTRGKTNGVTLDNDLVMGRWPELGREAKVEVVCNEGSKI